MSDPKVEPSPEEKRNGWTTETLTQYLIGRDKAFQSEKPDLDVQVENVERFSARKW